MRPRMWLALVGGGILSLVVVTTAQRFQPSTPDSGGRVTTHADEARAIGNQLTLTGNVRIELDGVTVFADRALIQDREVTLEGNVRLTLPKPVYTAGAMRDRIPTTRIPTGPQQIDPPMPQPWQPPPGNQR
jgi:lipopolysaccharide assembly outer membrane protein LptD (OstA)